MKLSQLASTLTSIDTNITDAQARILQKIQDLTDALNNADVDIPADAQTALDALTTEAENLANVVPDTSSPTDPTTPVDPTAPIVTTPSTPAPAEPANVKSFKATAKPNVRK